MPAQLSTAGTWTIMDQYLAAHDLLLSSGMRETVTGSTLEKLLIRSLQRYTIPPCGLNPSHSTQAMIAQHGLAPLAVFVLGKL